MKTRNSVYNQDDEPPEPKKPRRTKTGPKAPVKKDSPAKAKTKNTSLGSSTASGSNNDSFGMIQTSRTRSSTSTKTCSSKSKSPDQSSTPQEIEKSMSESNSLDDILSGESSTQPFETSTPQDETPSSLLQDNLDFGTNTVNRTVPSPSVMSSSYGQERSSSAPGSPIMSSPTGRQVIGQPNKLVSTTSPGYRISPSVGPLIGNQSLATPQVSNSIIRPVTSTSVMTSSYGQDRSSSDPGSPIMPSPTGPVATEQPNKLVSTTSPGSGSDQYRTNLSLRSNIDLSQGSDSMSNLIAGNRSTTSDIESMRTSTNQQANTSEIRPDFSDLPEFSDEEIAIDHNPNDRIDENNVADIVEAATPATEHAGKQIDNHYKMLVFALSKRGSSKIQNLI